MGKFKYFPIYLNLIVISESRNKMDNPLNSDEEYAEIFQFLIV